MSAGERRARAAVASGPRFAVFPLGGDPLALRLEVAVPEGGAEAKLPYYFADGDSWRIRDATGAEVEYVGPKVRRRSPESLGEEKGWVRVLPGRAPYVVDSIALHGSFQLDGHAGPFAYSVGGCECTVVGDNSAALPIVDDRVGKVSSPHHRVCMEMAIREAEKSVPSPKAYCVGCVIVPKGTAEALDKSFPVLTAESRAKAAASVLSTGFSRELPGNTHAEQCALMKMEAAGVDASGCDMYTSMEPCSVRLSGNVPCVKNCIKHGVGRVFVGVREPAHFVRCEGVAQLVAAGIPCFDVVWNGVESACLAPNQHIEKFRAKAGGGAK